MERFDLCIVLALACQHHCPPLSPPLPHVLLSKTQQDEVLSHRLGLVPLAIDPNAVAWKGVEDPVNESNTVVFKLDITCRREADGSMVNDKGVREAVCVVHVLCVEPFSKGSCSQATCRFCLARECQLGCQTAALLL